MISGKTIGRLSLYRRILNTFRRDDVTSIYSHQLATAAGVTAAQVRRDIMNIGYSGNPNRGYDVEELVTSIGNFLDSPRGQKVALIGVGNLGRAILAYFSGRRPKLSIVAAFDNDPDKTGRVIQGCRCYPVDELPAIVGGEGIEIATICVPEQAAQHVADLVVKAGIKGILNFAPVPLHVPPRVYVEDIDLTMSFEKVAYFAGKT